MAKRRSLLDRALGAIGLARAPQRAARSYFAGAGGGRLNADWVLGPTSADDEIKADGAKLRTRARQLRRDNALAARYVRLQVHGILGHAGIKLRAVVPNTRAGENSAAKTAIETGWRLWGAAGVCDVAGRLAWADVERLVVETWKTEGEAWVQLVEGADNPWGFAVNVIDPDQIDDSYNLAPANGRNGVRMGVELDARTGRPVAYHVWTAHPTSSDAHARIRTRIPASEIRHIFTPGRPGQTRGVTPFAPVMQSLKMLGGLQEAVLVLQRTAACKMGFLTPNERYEGPLEAPAGEERVRMDAEPGLIDQLPQGFDFTGWDPGQPTDTYAPFTTDVKREAAAGLDVSYASLTGDQSQANYGSQRVAMTDEREGYKRDAAYITRTLHDVVFARWIVSATLSGALRIPASVAAQGSEVAEWQARGFDWIDPEKDANASLLEVGAGLNSLTRIAASKGVDLADILAERAAEQALAAEKGVDLHLGPGAPPPMPEPAPPNESPEGRAVRLLRSATA